MKKKLFFFINLLQRWPFLDVIFYDENSTHIWEEGNYQYTSPKQYIFPLRLRPFGTLMLPTPYNPAGYLKATLGKDVNKVCIRDSWSHQIESGQSYIKKDCDELKSYYPFVDRECDNEKCEERLRIGDRVLWKFAFNKTQPDERY